MSKTKLLVEDYMKSIAHKFTADESVEEVVKTLCVNKITGAPVVDASNQIIGYISEQDCLKQMLNDAYYNDEHLNAGDIMRTNPLTVSPETDILHIAEDILNNKPKTYPVVDNGKLIGIITRSDILKALSLAHLESRDNR